MTKSFQIRKCEQKIVETDEENAPKLSLNSHTYILRGRFESKRLTRTQSYSNVVKKKLQVRPLETINPL